VPAIIFIPSERIAFANCLASLSVGNVLVCLVASDDFNRHCFGASNETNHRLVTARGPNWTSLGCLELCENSGLPFRSCVDINQKCTLCWRCPIPTPSTIARSSSAAAVPSPATHTLRLDYPLQSADQTFTVRMGRPIAYSAATAKSSEW
jgi:hypothetical protein